MSPLIISEIRPKIIDLMISWVGEDPKDAVLIQSHPCLASHLVRSTLLVKRPGQEEALMRGGYYRNCDQITSLSSEH